MTQQDGQDQLDAVDAERARLFALLGRLLGAAPDAALLARLRLLRGDASELGAAYAARRRSASSSTSSSVSAGASCCPTPPTT
jgi:hypothetical protein